MKWIAMGALIALLVGSPAKAGNPDTALWKTVNGWYVYIDKTLEYQCFIANLYDEGTIFRLGFQNPSSSFALYVAIGNSNWKSIENGKDYQLSLQIDNQPAWDSPASGIHIGDIPFLVVNTNQIKFVDEIKRKHGLRAYFNGRQILNLSLRGSSGALEELASCQTAVNAYLGRNQGNAASSPAPSDPFSNTAPSNTSNDPFASY